MPVSVSLHAAASKVALIFESAAVSLSPGSSFSRYTVALSMVLKPVRVMSENGLTRGGHARRLDVIPYPASSDTSSKVWNCRVMRDSRAFAWVVGMPARAFSMAARKDAKSG